MFEYSSRSMHEAPGLHVIQNRGGFKDSNSGIEEEVLLIHCEGRSVVRLSDPPRRAFSKFFLHVTNNFAIKELICGVEMDLHLL